MLTFISVLIILACVLLILVVLIQNPKGGGIAANFIAPNQIMGVKRSTDVIEKATWILAGVLIVLSLSTNFFRGSSSTDAEGPQSQILNNYEPGELPATPTLPNTPENSGEQQPVAPQE